MRPWGRAFAFAFGALLLGVGIYALTLDSPGSWHYIGGLAFCALGTNAVYCEW